MKNLLIAFIGLLLIASCKKKDDPIVAPVAVDGVTVSPATASVTAGATLSLKATVTPENAADKSVTWTSSDSNIAAAADDGTVTGKSPGTAVITAASKSNPSKTAACTVTVLRIVSVSAIALGDEGFAVRVPAPGGTTAIANAPRTIASALAAVKVTLTAATGASVKIGTNAFVSGSTADFTRPVTFTLTSQDGATVSAYTVAIAAYDPVSNPYGIYTPAHLNKVRAALNDSYKMMNDIDLPDRNAEGAAAIGISDYAAAGWAPIGGEFKGKFDGGNFSVNNFYIRRIGGGFIGLFEQIVSPAAISNLGITGSASPAVTGGRYTGALAGRVTRGAVTNCYSEVAVRSEDGNVSAFTGGLIGYMSGGSITNSYSSGNVSGNHTYVHRAMGRDASYGLHIGGLAGVARDGAALSNCFATGNIDARSAYGVYGGGLTGYLGFYNLSPSASIANCYAAGNVECIESNENTDRTNFIGRLGYFVNSTFTDCYRNSTATLTDNGGAVTEDSGGGITNKTRDEMQANDFRDLLNNGGSAWGRDGGKNGGLPYINGVGVGK